MIVRDGGKRSKAQREAVKQVYSRGDFVAPMMRLNLTRYTSWHCWWDRISPEAAERNFRAALAAQPDD